MEITRGCFSPANISCSDITISCGDNQIIEIQNIQKSGTCNQTDDCVKRKNGTALFYQYRWNTDTISIFKQCSSQQSCTIVSPYGVNNSPRHRGLYAYIKYTYRCLDVKASPSLLTPPATESSTVSVLPNVPNETTSTIKKIQVPTPGGRMTAIIGGVLGTALIISIVIIIVLVIYFNSMWKTFKSGPCVDQNEHQYHYDSTSSSGTTDQRIANGEAPTHQNNQYYEHQYDSTTGRGSVAGYDSLNTREETGYYNMGNINTTGK
ncbi:hypothetical protein SNE40_020636 [Patella caerulea]|uniref:Uncharacterized protein n=1 Tax=Patella caerulea TaxID=87958 RepID=A0AAN8P7I5_PATCE